MNNMYGKELIMDLHECDVSKFNRKDIETYLIELCDNVIYMEREALHWWDYQGLPEEYEKAPDHLKGTSAIQFITTSNITIHTLDVLGKVFLNIFSCKNFNEKNVQDYCLSFFKGRIVKSTVIERI